MTEEEQKTETEQSALKENVVAVAKIGGFMIFIAAIGFLFLLLAMLNWMANP